MFDELYEAKDINELKKVYKKLAKKYHPDIGGNEEDFKKLNSSYQNLLSKNQFDFKIDIEIENVISEVLHFDLLIEIVGSWIWISGDTKPHKEELKKANFKWHSKRKKWYWTNQEKGRATHSKEDFETIKNKYGSTVVKSNQKYKLIA